MKLDVFFSNEYKYVILFLNKIWQENSNTIIFENLAEHMNLLETDDEFNKKQIWNSE